MRKLKFHEKKLLKKVDFLQWKKDQTLREATILRRYMVQDREDYTKYNKLCGVVKKLTTLLRKLEPTDPVRIQVTEQLLDKLYNLGVITTRKSLVECDKITASAFCRRRLPVVLVRLKYAQTLREAVTLIEQGHIRVGPQVITDPAYLVSRSLEDFITWVDTSKIKRIVMKYNDKLDDYDLLS